MDFKMIEYPHRAVAADMTQKPPRGLSDLPTELIQEILLAIPDVDSLRVIIRTSSHLYACFKSAETKIVKSVLQHQIGTELIHDAIATEISSKCDSWTDQEHLDFLEKFHDRDQQPFRDSLPKSIPQTHTLLKFHDAVEFLATVFVSNSWGTLTEAMSAKTPAFPPTERTETERMQICRNFYRFQLHQNVYLDWRAKGYNYKGNLERALAHLSPWENGQLICISGFLNEASKSALKSIDKWALNPLRPFVGPVEGRYHPIGGLSVPPLPNIKNLLESDTPQMYQEIFDDWKTHVFTSIWHFPPNRWNFNGGSPRRREARA